LKDLAVNSSMLLNIDKYVIYLSIMFTVAQRTFLDHVKRYFYSQ